MNKVCKKCQIDMPSEMFYKTKRNKKGDIRVSVICRFCINAYSANRISFLSRFHKQAKETLTLESYNQIVSTVKIKKCTS